MALGDDDSLIKVQYATLEQATSDVQSTVNFMNQQLDALYTYLKELKQMWQGKGGDYYRAEQQKWDKAAKDLNAVLAAVPPALREARSIYADTDGVRVAGLWGGGGSGSTNA